MARLARLESPGTLHPVLIQATQGQPLFHEEKGCPHEMGIPFAEIARYVGVRTSAVAKAVESFSAER